MSVVVSCVVGVGWVCWLVQVAGAEVCCRLCKGVPRVVGVPVGLLQAGEVRLSVEKDERECSVLGECCCEGWRWRRGWAGLCEGGGEGEEKAGEAAVMTSRQLSKGRGAAGVRGVHYLGCRVLCGR